MPARHALIVGIDRYSNFEEQYQLSGCVNDARLIKSVLIDHFNFDESKITELHDAEASQQGILDAMAQLADRIGQDDVVVFHFSGHGRQRTSSNADAEGIGLDSTITPSDSGAVDPYPNLDITDDMIRDWLERLAEKTRFTTLIFDCCHSGTITRDASSAKIRGLPADRRALSSIEVQGIPRPDGLPVTRGGGSVARRIDDAYVVISGCRDDQYSHEYCFEQGDQLVRSGALTHFLTQSLMRARPGTTYRDVFELARQGVNSRFPQQHPQIEGAQDREIFGVRDIEPIRFIPVAAVDGDRVTLGGGAAHGLSVGSVWTAYPPGTKQTRGTAPLGKIEIKSVDALSADGLLVDGGELVVGARCVESAPAADRFLLRVSLVDLDEDSRVLLEERVAGSSLLTTTKSSTAADMRVRIMTAADGDSSADTEGRAVRVDEPSWVVVDRAGELAFPVTACGEDGAVEKLVSNFEAIARYRNALALDNPDSELDVDFNIYRVDAEGKLEDANGGAFTFDEGDQLAFEIVNREERNVFVSVLDFGVTGRVSLVYPQNRAGEMVAAGNTFRYGLGRYKLTLGVPRAFHGTQGTETLKAFISTDEADFRWLQQGGTRSVGSGCIDLRRQFEAAYHGPGTREIATVDTAEGDEQDWKAPARSFELRRRPE